MKNIIFNVWFAFFLPFLHILFSIFGCVRVCVCVYAHYSFNGYKLQMALSQNYGAFMQKYQVNSQVHIVCWNCMPFVFIFRRYKQISVVATEIIL